MAVGASYDVYDAPSNFRQIAHGARDALVPRQIRIIHVLPLYSEGTLMNVEKAWKHKSTNSGDSFVAVLNSWSLPPKFKRHIEHLENEIEELSHLSPPSAPDVESPIRYFHVTVGHGRNGKRSFRIETDQDGHWVPVSRVPFIRLDDPDAKSKVSYMLRHLARFRALANHDYAIEGSNANSTADYTFELLGAEKTDGVYETKHGDEVDVRFRNNSKLKDHNVHIAIFMFNATWGVERLHPHPDDGQTTTHLVPQTEI